MTQFVQNTPALRRAAQKARAVLGAAAWPAAGFLLTRVQLFGVFWPAAGALVLGAPMPLLAFAAAGGVLGGLLFLPAAEAAKQIAVIGAVCLARLVLRDKGGRLPAFIGAGALLLAEIVLQLRGGGRFADSFTAAAQAGAILLLAQCGAQMAKAALRGGFTYAAQSENGSVLILGTAALAALAGLSPAGINMAAVAAGVLVLVLARRQAWEKMLVAGLCAGAVLPAANLHLAAFGLAIGAGALALYALRPAERSGLAGVFVLAGLWGGLLSQSGRLALLCVAVGALAAAIFLLLPTDLCEGQTVGKDAASACAARLSGLARALADISDTVTDVCGALPAAQNRTLADTLCAGVCKNCKNNCVCWVEYANDMTDGVLQLEQMGGVPAFGLPGAPGRLCQRPAQLAGAAQEFFARRLALRCATARTDALRSAVTEQLAALCQTLGDTAAELTRPAPQLRYDVQISTQGDAAAGVSADASRSLTDQRGRVHLILSDGTGTGSAAAVDGSMAVSLMRRLLAAGFEAGPAARLVNIALSLTGAESSATLDVVSMDLTNGDCHVYKAGAASTFFVREGRVGALSASTVPVGMLGGVQSSLSNLHLVPGDLAVLVSDGMLANGEEWLAAELSKLKERPPEQIAQLLLAGAKKRLDGRADDMTVTVARLVARR